MKLLLQLIANGIVNAALYSLMAVGFGLVYRTTAIFHIAYGGLYTIGAYLLYIFAVLLGFPIIIALILSVALTSLFGFLIEKGVYLPFFKKEASSGILLIASLGLYIVIENLIAMIFGNEVKIVETGIQPTFYFGPIILTRIQLIELAAGIVFVSLFWLLTVKVRVFKAVWAMGDEPVLVSVHGIPLYRLRALVFAVSSFFIAIPACLISIDVGMDPHMGMSYLLISAVSVLFGGIDSYAGWVVGAFVLAILQSLAVWKLSARWMDLVTFLLLVIILLTRPQGLLGTRRRLEEE